MIYLYPGPGPTPAVSLIANARHEVRLNTYELTSKPIERALAAAAERGIKVYVMLDRSPYYGSSILRRERLWCQSVTVVCKLSPPRFRFDHAKYMIADRAVWIGTMNFTYYGFHRNREAAYVTDSPVVAKAASEVFNADWRRKYAGPNPRKTLVLSPGSTSTLLRLIQSASGPVKIESEELGYLGRLSRAFVALGSRLSFILPTRLSRADRRHACNLASADVHVRLLAHPYPHIKLIITHRIVFLGSENLTHTSLGLNREMGVLLSPRVASSLVSSFGTDWNAARPLSCPNGLDGRTGGNRAPRGENNMGVDTNLAVTRPGGH